METIFNPKSPSMRRKAIAARLFAIAESKNWSRKQLAAEIGRSESYVSRLLNGELNLTLETLSEIEDKVGEKLLIDPTYIQEKQKKRDQLPAGLLRLSINIWLFHSISNFRSSISCA